MPVDFRLALRDAFLVALEASANECRRVLAEHLGDLGAESFPVLVKRFKREDRSEEFLELLRPNKFRKRRVFRDRQRGEDSAMNVGAVLKRFNEQVRGEDD